MSRLRLAVTVAYMYISSYMDWEIVVDTHLIRIAGFGLLHLMSGEEIAFGTGAIDVIKVLIEYWYLQHQHLRCGLDLAKFEQHYLTHGAGNA